VDAEDHLRERREVLRADSLIRSVLAVALALVTAGCAHRLVEEQLRIPVKVADARGRQVERPIVVTVFYEAGAPKPYPALVLNHGRSPKAEVRQDMGRAKYSAASAWFANFGFMVAVPTRVGYGVTGGDDVEDSGPCDRKTYPPVYQASAAQTLAVLDVLRQRTDVSKDRAVVAGQSFGGTTAITVAALNPAGVQAAINFAGGGGGNPETRPQNPCGQPLLKRLFAGYGRTARIPTLWIYSENDMYMGPTLPKEWFDAFKAAGGVGEYVLFPAHGADGHGLFTRAPEVWQPRVLEFLRSVGYRPLRTG
jgi:dienelactone hydrolase